MKQGVVSTETAEKAYLVRQCYRRDNIPWVEGIKGEKPITVIRDTRCTTTMIRRMFS